MKVKKTFFLLLAMLWFWFGAAHDFTYSQGECGRIAMVIASRSFRDEELLVPKSIFEHAGYKTAVFADSLGEAKGMLGAVVRVDKTIEQLNPNEYDAVIFVGGSGAKVYWNDPRAHKIAGDTLSGQKVLGAICTAPVTLANAGVLKGRTAAVWPSEKGRLEQKGAVYTGREVEVSENIVTADGPQSSEKFAETILKLLKKREEGKG